MKELTIELTRELNDGINIFALKGVLGIEGAEGLSKLFDACQKENKHQLILNFNGVEFISSAGMGVLLSSVGDFRKKGGDIVLMNLQRKVEKVFKSLDVIEYFRIFSVEDEAVEALRGGLPPELIPKEDENSSTSDTISSYTNSILNIANFITQNDSLDNLIKEALNTIKSHLSILDILFVPISLSLKDKLEIISMGSKNLKSISEQDIENIVSLLLLRKSIITTDEIEDEHKSEYISLMKVGCELVIPVSNNGKLEGVILLGHRDLGAEYRTNDIAFLEVITKLIGIGINFKNIKETVETEETKIRFSELNFELEKRVQEIETLLIATRELSSSLELTDILNKFLMIVVGQLGTDRALIYLYDKKSREFKYSNHKGDINPQLIRITFKTNLPIIKKLSEEKDIVFVNEEKLHSQTKEIDLFKREKISLIVSIRFKGKLIGVILLGRKVTGKDYSDDELHIITSLSLQLGGTISNSELYEELQEAFNGTIRALIYSLEARDPYTKGHSENVTRLALRFAEKIGLEKANMKYLLIGAILHDIGKIGVAENVLKKIGPYTDEEEKEMQKHVNLGYNILQKAKLPPKVLDIVKHHHERVDGKGYPDKLMGDKIPIEAKIISICNTYSSLLSERRYREAMTKDEALRVLIEEKGKQLDPELVDEFVDMIIKEETEIEDVK
ncbi:MAG: HD domain-containing phosphohydrolase [bacterium]